MNDRNDQETARREMRPEERPVADRVTANRVGRRRIGRIVGFVIVIATLLIVCITLYISTVNPTTHDASVGANYIGLAPEVSGRVFSLYVSESTCVQKGALLVEIDPRDYEAKLQSAQSEQQDLEAQIMDKQRQINAAHNQAKSSFDKLQTSKIDLAKSDDEIASSQSDIEKARASLEEARASYELSELTVERNRPLAERQYISKQKFDQYVSDRDTNANKVKEAQASLRSSEVSASTSVKGKQESSVNVDYAQVSYQRDQWSVPTLDALIAQRPGKASDVEQARVDLGRTRIYSPINGCVTALNISRGAYASSGSALFTLIDNDSWYITAAYRESDLQYIRPGMKAIVNLMSDPHYALDGSVESIGNAVQSSDSLSSGGNPGTPGSLPKVERSMNWVRLASRYPVRIRFKPRDPSTLRVGTTANVMIVH